MPIAFGALNDLTGIWQSCFWLLFALVATALVWMHVAVRQMERTAQAAGVSGVDFAGAPGNATGSWTGATGGTCGDGRHQGLAA